MKRIRYVLVLTVLSFSFLQSQELASPESIVWDHVSERYLVSNAGDGLLRAVELDGASSVYGLEAKASHGLVIVADRLYACYRTTVRAYNLETEALIDVYEIPDAKFLNGICADSDGMLYVTDFTTKSIYRIELDRAGDMRSSITWKRLDRIPNGIAYHSDRDELLTVTWGTKGEVYCIDRTSADISDRIPTGYDNLEAILIEGEDIYMSAWSPAAIFHYPIGLNESAQELVIEELEKPTGLCLDADGNVLHLRSDADGISGLSKSDALRGTGVLAMAAFPNPVSINTLVSYRIAETSEVKISLYDCRGNLVENIRSSHQEAGEHQFFYERGRHSSGLYFLHIQTATESQAMGLTLMD